MRIENERTDDAALHRRSFDGRRTGERDPIRRMRAEVSAARSADLGRRNGPVSFNHLDYRATARGSFFGRTSRATAARTRRTRLPDEMIAASASRDSPRQTLLPSRRPSDELLERVARGGTDSGQTCARKFAQIHSRSIQRFEKCTDAVHAGEHAANRTRTGARWLGRAARSRKRAQSRWWGTQSACAPRSRSFRTHLAGLATRPRHRDALSEQRQPFKPIAARTQAATSPTMMVAGGFSPCSRISAGSVASVPSTVC